MGNLRVGSPKTSCQDIVRNLPSNESLPLAKSHLPDIDVDAFAMIV